jgi:hypothetical protein
MVTPLGDVVVKDTGNPSGQGNTIIDNTMLLYRFLCYAFIILWRREHSQDKSRIEQIQAILVSCNDKDDSDIDEEALEEELDRLLSHRLSQGYMHNNSVFVLNGDDNDFSVCEDIIGWFNARNVAEIWSGIGITTKSPCWEPRPIQDLEFLSQHTVYSAKYNKYLPAPEHERIMDSLLYGSESTDVRWSLLRAYALRIESFANEKTRAEIWSYIQYIWKTYKHELGGYVKIPSTGQPLSYDDITQTLMNDRELEMLYCGIESDSSTLLRWHAILERAKLINNTQPSDL